MWGSLAWAGVLGRGHSPDWPAVVTVLGDPSTLGRTEGDREGLGAGLTWGRTSVLGVGSSWRWWRR